MREKIMVPFRSQTFILIGTHQFLSRSAMGGWFIMYNKHTAKSGGGRRAARTTRMHTINAGPIYIFFLLTTLTHRKHQLIRWTRETNRANQSLVFAVPFVFPKSLVSGESCHNHVLTTPSLITCPILFYPQAFFLLLTYKPQEPNVMMISA